MTAFPDVLVEAAQFERDRRAERYPALVEGGKLGADEATIDYQCWVIIAEWFESGRFAPIYNGGIDGRTEVEWALAEQAAERALAKVAAKAGSLGEGDTAFAEIHRRRANLVCIHRAVQLRRQSIDSINRDLRQRHTPEPERLSA